MNFCKSVIVGRRRSFIITPLSRSLWTLFKNNFGVYETIADVGNVTEIKKVPDYIWAPPYANSGIVNDEPDQETAPEIHSDDQIQMLRQSCKLAKLVLDSTKILAKPGTTTEEIDCYVHDLIISNNAYPSPLNYKGFKKSVCTSVNNVLCHGVPDDRPLMDGDLISVDVSVYLNGYHGDCCATYCVGQVDELGKNLISVAQQCLIQGIEACGPGRSFTDIGKAIETFCHQSGHNVVSSITGHGIGKYFHGPPAIYHTSLYCYPGIMKPGMIFTIEPVVCQGSEDIAMLDDGWTIVSNDNSRGAQFEHTILITNKGYDVLTK